MSLNENDIVFRWVDNSEITKCKVGNCTLDLDFTISRQELIRMGLSIDGDLTIRCSFTKALYNLESSKKKNISIAKYLSVSKGLGGQYSGWLEYRSTASKNRLLNCTIDHKNTFGQDKDRTLVYFPFVDCKNSNHLRGRKKEELQKLCSYPFNLEICKLINNLPLEQPFSKDIEHVQNLTRLSSNSEVEQDYTIIYPENNKIKEKFNL